MRYMYNQREDHATNKNATEYKLEGGSGVCYLWTNEKNHVIASGFTGKRKKADFFYRYVNTEQAIEKINTFLTNVKRNEEADRKRKEEAKVEREKLAASVEVGSIFVCSWGYGQTNVDAYQVVEKRGKYTVVLREIGYDVVSESAGHDCCHVKPVKDSFVENGEELTKQIGVSGRIRINSYSSAGLWDGKSDYYKSWYY